MSRPTVTWGLLALAACAVAVVLGVAVLLDVAKPVSGAVPDYRVVSLGGLQYEAISFRDIKPTDPVDAEIVRGVPARESRLARGQSLFGVFVAVSNDSLRSLPAAGRLELRDANGREYRPLPLPAANPYAYVPRLVPPKTRLPGHESAADRNLAAGGYLVLFRAADASIDAGPLELVIHDPRDPRRTTSLFD
jgi:hypothetical protein